MYDMKDCAKCGEDAHKEYENMGSRMRSAKYHEEEYDDIKGKGAFKKNSPATAKLVEGLLDRRTALLNNHLSHTAVVPITDPYHVEGGAVPNNKIVPVIGGGSK